MWPGPLGTGHGLSVQTLHESAPRSAKENKAFSELLALIDMMRVDQTRVRALFDDTRRHIIDMLSERAATTSQLAEALDRPKGSVGHHIGVLETGGLIRVVRTEKVRAIEAKYYRRTARTFDYSKAAEHGIELNTAFTRAASEISESRHQFSGREMPGVQGVRYARISAERAEEWTRRLWDLVEEFIESPREGDIVYGLAVALYPTNRPSLP